MSNIAAVTALAGPDTLIISDAHNHASLIDACRLAKAPTSIVAHNDLDAVEAALAGRQQSEALVVVESVYSVFGDTADLPCLLDLCVRYDALLLVDEAHGIGVTGAEAAVGMGGGRRGERIPRPPRGHRNAVESARLPGRGCAGSRSRP
ncbi:MAG: aminotransferase class I/II-fold pyridoxal phosphate-dependent enzyme [Brevibacterium linens]|uniref:aminotransferase class I/II-fold pyridoxal phosphate-dependent enzyme n=1 Tax=Brevibacterium linens TaxID=1703 RepID=UPI003F959819